MYPNIWPVIYQNQRVDFGELYKQGKIGSVTNATLFKSPDWKYEKEWRLVWSDYFDEYGTYVKDGGCMREIYLGTKVDLSGKNIKRILNHADNIGVPVFKMELSSNTYKTNCCYRSIRRQCRVYRALPRRLSERQLVSMIITDQVNINTYEYTLICGIYIFYARGQSSLRGMRQYVGKAARSSYSLELIKRVNFFYDVL